MTEKQEKLVIDLRLRLLRAGYPPIYGVTNEELTAVEQYLFEWMESFGVDNPILKCGKNGLYFKGCELVLIVESNEQKDI